MKQVRFLLLVISLLSVNCGGQTPAAPADTLAQSTVDASGADVTQTDTASPTSDATVIKDTGPAPSPFDGVGAVIEARMKSANIPGLAAAVTARGQLTLSFAHMQPLLHGSRARALADETLEILTRATS